jgi:hypothetical protein
MRIIFLFFSLVIINPFYLLSQDAPSTAGTSSSLFLRSSISTKAAGLSDAYTALSDDENAIFFNPAGLAKLKAMSFSLNHTEWLEDIRFDNFVFAYNFLPDLSGALSFSHMWMPSITGRDESGVKTSDINVSSSIINLAGAYKFAKGFQGGLGLKYVVEDLAGSKAGGIAFDFGLLWDAPLSGFTFGLAALNMGGQMKYGDSKYDIPFNYRFGMSYKPRPVPLKFALDVVKPVDGDFMLSFGSEYSIMNKYYVQIGNQFRGDSPFTPSFGLGGSITDKIEFNYSFSSPSEVGFSNRIGFKFNFGAGAPARIFKPTTAAQINLIPPKGLKVQLQNENLFISWESISGLKYNVYAKNSEGLWTKITKEPLSENYLVLKNPKPSTSYTFCVTGVQGETESAYSSEVTINVD